MVAILVAVLVVLVAIGVVLARRGAAGVQRKVEEQLAGLDVRRQAKANFYGLASAGSGQARGLGVLVLTPEELRFVQFVGDRDVRVPRSSITSATVTTSFLGTTQAKELLVVAWDGTPGDEGAWDVPAADEWRTALTGA